jgi:hypothetical protein
MEFKFNRGRMLFWGVGNINSNKQTHIEGNIPPVSRGLWAFPWPYHDYFFVYQKYEKFLPKKYQALDKLWGTVSQEEYDALWEEREKLTLKIMKREHPKTFWYGGGFYSHISPGVSHGEDWYFWDSVRDWGKVANKQIIFRAKWAGVLLQYPYCVDHLEIFIPNY